MLEGTAFPFVAVKKIQQMNRSLVTGLAVVPFELATDRFTAHLLPRHLFDLLNVAFL